MSGFDGYFVVVWDASADEPTVTQVTRWDEWVRIPIEARPFNTTMVRAKDELDAYASAMRGESWDEWDNWSKLRSKQCLTFFCQ